VWGCSPDLPDAILLLSPKEMTKFSDTVDRFIDGLTVNGAVANTKSPKFDDANVMVYKSADFESLHRQIATAHDAWMMFRIGVAGGWTIPGLTADEARRRLVAIPEIRSKIDYVRQKRGEAPLPQ
jgi:hypothetical protein